MAADHVAAGSFETAMQLLQRQLGIISFGPLKPAFMAVAAGSHGAFSPAASPSASHSAAWPSAASPSAPAEGSLRARSRM